VAIGDGTEEQGRDECGHGGRGECVGAQASVAMGFEDGTERDKPRGHRDGLDEEQRGESPWAATRHHDARERAHHRRKLQARDKTMDFSGRRDEERVMKRRQFLASRPLPAVI
jgi:hypothetical protein